MRWHGLYLKVFSLWFAVSSLCGWAQIQGKAHAYAGVDASGNSETVEAALRQMTDRAAIIFVGTVADVHRISSAATGADTVEIRFNVERPIRGCSGSTYTLREWGGFWSANDSRYRVGQHLLLLLHAPGATGLSSPVGGMDGAIPIRASGAGIRASETSAAAAEQVADLRWVAAKLVRTVNYRNTTPVALALPRSSTTERSSEATPDTPADRSVPAQETAVSTIVTMIQGWGVQTNATR